MFTYSNGKTSIRISDKGYSESFRCGDIELMGGECPFAVADGRLPVSAAGDGETLTVKFTDEIAVKFELVGSDECIIIGVKEYTGDIKKLKFAMFGVSEREGCAAAAMALNDFTNAAGLPGIRDDFWAMGDVKFGIKGCAYAITAAKREELRGILKSITAKYTAGIPYSPIGGAFAADNERVNGSYIFNFNGIKADEIDDWIEVVKAAGAKQIDFHGGSSFRFGDCVPDPSIFPDGRKSFKYVIDRLHEAGIMAGLHTYAEFISPAAEFVTPIPDKGLGIMHSFTLSSDMSGTDTVIAVDEDNSDVHNVTGFFVRNSVCMAIDDELILFTSVEPNKFTGCTRGAYGTKIAGHKKGTLVRHLKSCFGLFCPDPDTVLFDKVAGATADMFNECGFDMIYLDALDGSDLLGGSENEWYYVAKFVFAICEKLKKPAVMEMSTMSHHLWFVRSRLGAWDHSNRAHKDFIEQHNKSNIKMKRSSLLPHNFGWWCYGRCNVNDPAQITRMYMDDYEYWCRLSLANNYSLAFMGIDPPAYKSSDELRRIAALIKKYETLRHANTLPPETLEMLKTTECKLGRDDIFRPVAYREAKAVLGDEFVLRNPYTAHTPSIRIENAASVIKDDAYSLLDPEKDFNRLRVLSSLNVEAAIEKDGSAVSFTAIQNSGNMGCARYTLEYPENSVDISGKFGLGVWVCGDGKGEIINIQLKAPKHLNSGFLDRFIDVDFTGWRYITLLENDSARISEDGWPFSGGGHYTGTAADFNVFKIPDNTHAGYEWNDAATDAGLYQVSREVVQLNNLHSVSVWLNHMKIGESYNVKLGKIEALTSVKGSIGNITLSVNDTLHTINCSLPPDSYIEYSDGVWFGFDANGKAINEISADTLPIFVSGDNKVKINAAYTGISEMPRIKLTCGFVAVE